MSAELAAVIAAINGGPLHAGITSLQLSMGIVEAKVIAVKKGVNHLTTTTQEHDVAVKQLQLDMAKQLAGGGASSSFGGSTTATALPLPFWLKLLTTFVGA